jgi:pimeloyl-ACP methyl ester carboxylesterase
MQTIRTSMLEIAYEESGPAGGPPVILLHGRPSDPHDYDEVAPVLAGNGCRVLVAWLRGFGPTRFLENYRMALGAFEQLAYNSSAFASVSRAVCWAAVQG